MGLYDDMLQQMRAGVATPQMPQSAYWKRYDDTIAAMSGEQRAWVARQEEVINAKQVMFSVFLDYLFEANKDAFVSVGDGKYKGIVDSYIDTIQKSADGYVSRAESLERENEELRQQLKMMLEREKHGSKSMAANGAGRGGASNDAEAVRAGDPAERDDGNLPFFED